MIGETVVLMVKNEEKLMVKDSRCCQRKRKFISNVPRNSRSSSSSSVEKMERKYI